MKATTTMFKNKNKKMGRGDGNRNENNSMLLPGRGSRTGGGVWQGTHLGLNIKLSMAFSTINKK